MGKRSRRKRLPFGEATSDDSSSVDDVVEPLELKGSRGDIGKRNSQALTISPSRASVSSPGRRRISVQYQELIEPLEVTEGHFEFCEGLVSPIDQAG